jgi:phage gp36-like protein
VYGYVDRTSLEQRFEAQEIAELLGEEYPPDPGPAEAEPERLVVAIDDAEGLVNGYLSVRYALPLSFVPMLVSNWVADIVRFKLWDNKASAEVRQRYDDVLKQLEQFAKGFIDLPADEELEVGTAIEVPTVYRTFTRTTLAGFVGENTGGVGRKGSALEF